MRVAAAALPDLEPALVAVPLGDPQLTRGGLRGYKREPDR